MLRKRIPIGAGVIVALFGLVVVGGVATAIVGEAENASEAKKGNESALSETKNGGVDLREDQDASKFQMSFEEVSLRYSQEIDLGLDSARNADEVVGESEVAVGPVLSGYDEVYFVDPRYHDLEKPLVLFVKGKAKDSDKEETGNSGFEDTEILVSIAKQNENGEMIPVYERSFSRSLADLMAGVELKLDDFVMEYMDGLLANFREYEIEVTLVEDEGESTILPALYIYDTGMEDRSWLSLMPTMMVQGREVLANTKTNYSPLLITEQLNTAQPVALTLNSVMFPLDMEMEYEVYYKNEVTEAVSLAKLAEFEQLKGETISGQDLAWGKKIVAAAKSGTYVTVIRQNGKVIAWQRTDFLNELPLDSSTSGLSGAPDKTAGSTSPNQIVKGTGSDNATGDADPDNTTGGASSDSATSATNSDSKTTAPSVLAIAPEGDVTLISQYDYSLGFLTSAYVTKANTDLKLRLLASGASDEKEYHFTVKYGELVESYTFNGAELNSGEALAVVESTSDKIRTDDAEQSGFIVISLESPDFENLRPVVLKITDPELTFGTDSGVFLARQSFVRGVRAETPIEKLTEALSVGSDLGLILAKGDQEKFDELDSIKKSTNRETGLVKTGTKLWLTDNFNRPLEKFKTVVVEGDCNGDGRVTAVDLLMVRSHLIGKIKLSEEKFLAADFSQDETVSAIDLLVIQRYLIETGQKVRKEAE